MGKRSDFERVERDYYPTPLEAVIPLIPHLPQSHFHYTEPCAGDGRLADHITALLPTAHWRYQFDIEPQSDNVVKKDALTLTAQDVPGSEMFITNPPWGRKKSQDYILHKLIIHLSDLGPTWLLFDADWMHTKQATPFMGRLEKIVSVGRVKWIEGSKMTGKDNCAWHLFDRQARFNMDMPEFYGRDIIS